MCASSLRCVSRRWETSPPAAAVAAGAASSPKPASDAPRQQKLTTEVVGFLQTWLSFLRAIPIYPPTNSRVQQTLQQLMASVDSLMKGRGLIVSLDRSGIHVNGARLDTVIPGWAWIQERYERTAIEGVEFRSNVTPEAITAFALRLQDNIVRPERRRTFRDFWPDSYVGLRLIELLMASVDIERSGNGTRLVMERPLTREPARGHESDSVQH